MAVVLLLAMVAAAMGGGAFWRLTVVGRDLNLHGPDTTLWPATQAQLQLLTLLETLDALGDGNDGVTAADVALRFDILWSRLDLLQEGELGRRLAAHPQTKRQVRALDAILKAAEGDIAALRSGEHDAVNAVIAELAPATEIAHALTVESLHLDRQIREVLHDEFGRTVVEFVIFAGALAVMVVGLLVMLWRSHRRARHFLDLSERRRAALAKSRGALAEAQRLALIGSWEWDGASGRFACSDEALRLLGLDPRQSIVSRHDFLGSVVEADRERVAAALDGALNGGGMPEIKYRIRHADGDERLILASGRMIVDARDRVLGAIGVLQDITERAAAEAALVAAREQAEAASRAKSEFLAVMSHEVRTPLTGVIGLAELLLEHELAAEQRARAELLKDSSLSLQAIVDTVLDHSKLEAGRMILLEAPYDPRRLVCSITELAAPHAAAKGLRLACEVDALPPAMVLGDEGRVRQVLVNLVSNAVKFTHEGAVSVRASLRAEPRGARLRLEVVDSGIGIDGASVSRLFEAFYRGERSAAESVSGTGLGLFVSQGLVRLMGGEIGAYPNPSGGSVFWIEVPYRPVSAPGGVDEAAGRAAGVDGAAPGRHILVADDNETNRMIICDVLELMHCTCAFAQDGEQAVEMAAGGGFSAVLMDIRMPRVDGLEAARRIRALPGLAGRVPIIALTADAMDQQREACRQAGMDDFLPKPFTLRSLSKALRGHLDGSD